MSAVRRSVLVGRKRRGHPGTIGWPRRDPGCCGGPAQPLPDFRVAPPAALGPLRALAWSGAGCVSAAIAPPFGAARVAVARVPDRAVGAAGAAFSVFFVVA